MSDSLGVIEQLLADCGCATLATITQTLGTDSGNATQSILDFAHGKDNLQLIYSVCYNDANDNIILSHKTREDLEDLERKYRDVKSSLFACRIVPMEGVTGVPQKCWKQEIELVEAELKNSSGKGNLYIPRFAAVQTPCIRTRSYERVKQGDSSLCEPTKQQTVTASAKTIIPRPFHEKRADTRSDSRVERHSTPRAGTTTMGNATGVSQQKCIFGNATNERRANSDVANSYSDPDNDNTMAPAPSENIEDAENGQLDCAKRASTNTHASLDKEESRQLKRGKPVAADEVSEEARDDIADVSLFECDDPCDAMELDALSCNDGPVSYIEKVTKENTYIDSGYFVVEETNEYVEVTAPEKPQSAVAHKSLMGTQFFREKQRELLRKPQNKLKQLTVESFLRR